MMMKLILLTAILFFVAKPKRHKVSLVVAIDEDDRILLLKRSDDDDWAPGKWGLPGGHVDLGETYRTTARRELLEETNLKVRQKDLKYLGNAGYPHQRIFITRNWSGQVDLQKASHGFEHSASKWVRIDEINLGDCVPSMRWIAKSIKNFM